MLPNFKESRKRRTKKNNRKSTKRRTKRRTNRKSKQFGGGDGAPQPQTPPRLNHIHSHTIYICKGHFDAVFSGTASVCSFWGNIFDQLTGDREVDENAYVNQGTEGVRKMSPCTCCDISGNSTAKDCAVFSELQYCDKGCSADDLAPGCFKMDDGVCGACTLCNPI